MVNRKELDPESSPRAAFGARLRSSREARGWKQEDLSLHMGISSGHISGVETTRKMPSLRFAKAADMAFGVTDSAATFERQWREMHQGSLLEGFPEYVGYEGRAVEIRLFESGVIPGPLQTREYARALADCALQRGDITPEQADERVDFLIERQAALVRTPPPVLFAVLDESCIRSPIGGPDVMAGQFARLIEFAGQPNTAFQIAPFAMGGRKPFRRLVHLLTLSDRSLMSYVESQTHGYLDRELSSVVPLMRNYHQLQVEAASQAESVDMIEQLRKGTM
ncbi:helix-turn-helix domain-containing protein [Streptomyces sp. SID4919]|uniref:helix-turn-helix domain-containing protein n=1 Tax=unclassified Streptomyces TaxID=2593676 RepID=UPI000C07F5C0|nr:MULTISPECIES: helix-turn-helix transcriptional regulator [unclassified Streptomyces]MYY09438.1 helix-turn-helix domain-containing protein [Streptomyces sp. SID4919]